MQNASMNKSTETDSVRLKAYELWVSGGKREGVAVQNWLEAERILSSTSATISTHAVPANTQQATKGPELLAEDRVAGSTTLSSSPPLGLADISAMNKVSQKSSKSGSGRRR